MGVTHDVTAVASSQADKQHGPFSAHGILSVDGFVYSMHAKELSAGKVGHHAGVVNVSIATDDGSPLDLALTYNASGAPAYHGGAEGVEPIDEFAYYPTKYTLHGSVAHRAHGLLSMRAHASLGAHFFTRQWAATAATAASEPAAAALHAANSSSTADANSPAEVTGSPTLVGRLLQSDPALPTSEPVPSTAAPSALPEPVSFAFAVQRTEISEVLEFADALTSESIGLLRDFRQASATFDLTFDYGRINASGALGYNDAQLDAVANVTEGCLFVAPSSCRSAPAAAMLTLSPRGLNWWEPAFELRGVADWDEENSLGSVFSASGTLGLGDDRLVLQLDQALSGNAPSWAFGVVPVGPTGWLDRFNISFSAISDTDSSASALVVLGDASVALTASSSDGSISPVTQHLAVSPVNVDWMGDGFELSAQSRYSDGGWLILPLWTSVELTTGPSSLVADVAVDSVDPSDLFDASGTATAVFSLGLVPTAAHGLPWPLSGLDTVLNSSTYLNVERGGILPITLTEVFVWSGERTDTTIHVDLGSATGRQLVQVGVEQSRHSILSCDTSPSSCNDDGNDCCDAAQTCAQGSVANPNFAHPERSWGTCPTSLSYECCAVTSPSAPLSTDVRFSWATDGTWPVGLFAGVTTRSPSAPDSSLLIDLEVDRAPSAADTARVYAYDSHSCSGSLTWSAYSIDGLASPASFDQATNECKPASSSGSPISMRATCYFLGSQERVSLEVFDGTKCQGTPISSNDAAADECPFDGFSHSSYYACERSSPSPPPPFTVTVGVVPQGTGAGVS